MNRHTRSLAFFFILISLKCSKSYIYEPVSGGEIIRIRYNDQMVPSLKVTNNIYEIQSTAFLINGKLKVLLRLRNKTQESVAFNHEEIYAKINKNKTKLRVENCYKPTKAEFIQSINDFQIPCDVQLKAGENQIRFVYFESLTNVLQTSSYEFPNHELFVRNGSKNGADINFRFKFNEK